MGLSRSEHMARVRGTDTSPERLLRSALWNNGLRYRLNYKVPAGRPDLVFPGPKVAVSVDGCFWHGCPEHYSRPRTNREFWAEKLAANTERDSRLTLRLESMGWTMLRIWEHEVFRDLEHVVCLVEKTIRGEFPPSDRDWRVVRVDPVPEEGEDWERRELRMLRKWDMVRFETGPRRSGGGKRAARTNIDPASTTDSSRKAGGTESTDR